MTKRSTATYILPTTKIHKLEQIIAEYYKARTKGGISTGKLKEITKGKISSQAGSGSVSFLCDLNILKPDIDLYSYRLTELGLRIGACIMQHGDTSSFWREAAKNSSFVMSVYNFIVESASINKDNLIIEVVNRAGRDIEKVPARTGASTLLSILIKGGFVIESKEDGEVKISLNKQKTLDGITASNSIFGAPIKKYTYDLFVLMPFKTELMPVYEDHIKKVAGLLNLSIARADNFFSPNPIMSEIWSAIAQAKILVADCTDKNPNVFYEIGIAHAIDKPVILITQNPDDVPFDLRHRRYIPYSYTPPGMNKFEQALLLTINEVKKDLESVE